MQAVFILHHVIRSNAPSILITEGRSDLSPGFRRYAPTSLPACGGALQMSKKMASK